MKTLLPLLQKGILNGVLEEWKFGVMEWWSGGVVEWWGGDTFVEQRKKTLKLRRINI